MDRQQLIERIAAARQIDGGSGREFDRLTPAAVLIALVERPQGWHVILTRRTDSLRAHAGQISFPGGRIEPSDASIEAAALREAQEEVSLAPERVELLGRLGRYRTGTGFLIYPVVGLVHLPVVLHPEPGEVAEIFEVPLSFFLDPGNHKPHFVERNGRSYEMIAMPYGDYYIWGATAGMLRSLYHALTDAL